MIPELPRFLVSLYALEREYRLYAMDLDIPENNTPEKRISDELMFLHEGKFCMFSDEISPHHISEILIGSRRDFNDILNRMCQDLEGCYTRMELENMVKPSQVFSIRRIN